MLARKNAPKMFIPFQTFFFFCKQIKTIGVEGFFFWKTFHPILYLLIFHRGPWKDNLKIYLVWPYFPTTSTCDQHFSRDKYWTFLPIIVVVILWINTLEQNMALKAVEKLHQHQWKFSFHQIWGKTLFQPPHEISNNVVCATSKASDHPVHMRIC